MELVKRVTNKEGNRRISIYTDDYACNPMDLTDEPLHCEDWSHNISIANSACYENARGRIVRLLTDYGRRERIIKYLIDNGKHLTDGTYIHCNNALIYDKHNRQWVLKAFGKHYNYCTKEIEDDWFDYYTFDCRKDEIDLFDLLDSLRSDTLDCICAEKYWNDGIRIASYYFDYMGAISFSNYFDTSSDGIAWLEKDEFLEYSGCGLDYWRKKKTLGEIEFLLEEEIRDWSLGNVYGYIAETLKDGEWIEEDSCCCFYGDIDLVLEEACRGSEEEWIEEVV